MTTVARNFIFGMAVVLGAFHASAGQSVSEQYSGFQTASPYQDHALIYAAEAVQKQILNTPNFQKMSKWAKEDKPLIRWVMDRGQPYLYKVETTPGEFASLFLTATYLSDEGDSLIGYDFYNKNSAVFVSMKMLGLEKYRIAHVMVSPNHQFVVLLLAHDGINTNYQFVIYSFVQKKIVVPLTSFAVSNQECFWTKDSKQFAFIWQNTSTRSYERASFRVDMDFDSSGSEIPVKFVGPLQVRQVEARPIYMTPETPVVTDDWVRSEDGTMVNYRLIYLRDAKRDKSHPAFIYSYGGAEKSMNKYILKSYPFEVPPDFLKRGGILVLPSLRGGLEGGHNWYTQSLGPVNKMKAFQDLIAVGKDLVAKGWTTSDKIISVGMSNGGLTVAASALLAPETFGLVIPIAGFLDPAQGLVQDPYVMPALLEDYGDPRTQKDLIEKYSPVELAKNNRKTKFLILAGKDDDRVNFVNSLKFMAALQTTSSNPNDHLLFVRDGAGHDTILEPDFGDDKAISGTALVWTHIYNYLGWQVTEDLPHRMWIDFY